MKRSQHMQSRVSFIFTFLSIAIFTWYANSLTAWALLPLTQRDIDFINKSQDWRDPEEPQGCDDNLTVAGGSSVYLIGDSWLTRMESASPSIQSVIEEAGFSVTGINSSVGRSINGGGQDNQSALEALEADKDKILLASTVVVVLGTNGDNYDDAIPKFVQALYEIRVVKIIWVNTTANSSTAVANSAGAANAAIKKYSDPERLDFDIVDFFSLVYPSDPTPESITVGIQSPLMDSDQIHPSIPEGVDLLVGMINSAISGSSGGTIMTTNNAALPEVARSRLSQIEDRVAQNQSVYQELSSQYGLPWQVFGALHYREAGSDPERSMLGGEPLGTAAVDSGLTPDTLLDSGQKAYDLFVGLAKSVYDIEVSPSMSFEDLQYAFLAYHRGALYREVPPSEGGPWLPDIAPYVMNLYDENHTGPEGQGMERPKGTSGTVGVRGEWGETVSGIDSPAGAMTFIAYFGFSPGGSSTCGPNGSLGPGEFRWPVVEGETPIGRITACWSDLRHQTISGGSYYHSGIDIAAGAGTKVIAVQGGTVVFAGLHTTYGNLVVVDHGNGIWTHYGHLRSIADGITQDATIEAGATLGEVGNTGVSLGDHLHLNMYRSWPFGALPEGAANSNGQETINPLTNGLSIPTTVEDEAGCSEWPDGGREVNIEL